jgi:hypothetical protein
MASGKPAARGGSKTFCRLKAPSGAFRDALALELRDRGEDMEDQPAGRSRRVDILGHGSEACAALLDAFHEVEKVPKRSRQAIIFRHHDHIARPQMIEEAAEYNRSLTGVMKNAFDQAYVEWVQKPIGFLGYGSVGASRAVEHARTIAVELGFGGQLPTRCGPSTRSKR